MDKCLKLAIALLIVAFAAAILQTISLWLTRGLY